MFEQSCPQYKQGTRRRDSVRKRVILSWCYDVQGKAKHWQTLVNDFFNLDSDRKNSPSSPLCDNFPARKLNLCSCAAFFVAANRPSSREQRTHSADYAAHESCMLCTSYFYRSVQCPGVRVFGPHPHGRCLCIGSVRRRENCVLVVWSSLSRGTNGKCGAMP